MSSSGIRAEIRRLQRICAVVGGDEKKLALWEIALQLAIMNETGRAMKPTAKPRTRVEAKS